MNTTIESRIYLVLPLLIVAAGMAYIARLGLPLPSSKLLGGFLFVIGALNASFYRQISSRIYERTSNRPVVGWYWVHCGESGARLLFLGIAIVLAIVGGILLAFGRA
jgi:hypothetical protein